MSVLCGLLGIMLAAWAAYALLPTIYCKHLRDHRLRGQGRQILLSFDDGPDPVYTPQLLELLARQQAPALFMVLGEQAARYPWLLGQMLEQGHTVGLHGGSHRNPWLLTPWQMRREFEQGLRVLQGLGVPVKYYRPPHGNINLATLYYARRYRLRIVLWSVMVGDWRIAGADEIADRLLDAVNDRAVICLHDAGEHSGGAAGAPRQTIAALERLLPLWRRQGYAFAAAGEARL
ncbi:MAG: polysaccharide deacetylase family protein [Bacillota bacterium]|nr:polysaccharide deacetylase family protein [Bacillota bacterium]